MTIGFLKLVTDHLLADHIDEVFLSATTIFSVGHLHAHTHKLQLKAETRRHRRPLQMVHLQMCGVDGNVTGNE